MDTSEQLFAYVRHLAARENERMHAILGTATKDEAVAAFGRLQDRYPTVACVDAPTVPDASPISYIAMSIICPRHGRTLGPRIETAEELARQCREWDAGHLQARCCGRLIDFTQPL